MKKKEIFPLATAVLAFCIIVIAPLCAQSQTETGKTFIAYFSLPETSGVGAVSGASRVVVDGKVSGNVEFVARHIQKTVGGDLFAIQTVETYPGEHRPLLDAAKNEQSANARPPLATHIRDLQNYDTIFLGYPIWWYDLPMPIYSFLDEYDFAGKTLWGESAGARMAARLSSYGTSAYGEKDSPKPVTAVINNGGTS